MLALALTFALPGCGSPDKANIELRKKNQELQEQIKQLANQRDADLHRIQGFESHATTVPVLAEDRLDKLFTVQSFKIGRLTNGDAQNMKVYVVPLDANGDELKATGTWEIDAFDLADQERPRVGHWQFTTEDCKKNWVGFLLRNYVIACPWQHPPKAQQLTIRVTFRDELTQRVFPAQEFVAKVDLTPIAATQPAR